MRLRLTLLVILWAASSVADVYRWTDEAGQVHYGEHPPGASAEKIELPSSGQMVDPDTQRRLQQQQKALDAYDHSRARKQEKTAQSGAQKAADEKRCRQLQQQWRFLNHGGPIFYPRADGGRDYLSEEQRAAKKREMLPAYRQYCGESPE